MSKQIKSQSKQLLTNQQNPNTKSKITTLDIINQTKQNLDQVISQLNHKLHDHFTKKQQQLLNKYQQQLIQSQKQLNQLKLHTNQQTIKTKMAQRKKQLQKERHQLIQTNVFFSHKCQEYKKKLNQLMTEGKQLQKQIIFLDNQIYNVHKRKGQVLLEKQLITPLKQDIMIKKVDKVDRLKPQRQKIILPLVSDRKQSQIKPQKRLKNSYSLRQASKLSKLQKSTTQQKQKILKNQQTAINKVQKQLQKTTLQHLFESTIQQIKSKRKGKRSLTNVKGQEFSQYQKKLIMEQFLSKDQVKKQIYSIIFDLDQQSNYNNSPFSFQYQKSKLFQDQK